MVRGRRWWSTWWRSSTPSLGRAGSRRTTSPWWHYRELRGRGSVRLHLAEKTLKGGVELGRPERSLPRGRGRAPAAFRHVCGGDRADDGGERRLGGELDL